MIGAAKVRRMADMRYAGQGFEITVMLDSDQSTHAVRSVFDARYRALFSRPVAGAPIDLVAIRLALTAEMPGRVEHVAISRAHAEDRPRQRTVWFGTAPVTAAVHRRASLAPGARISGPAVLEEDESTLVIGPGGEAEVLSDGSVLVSVPA